MKKGEHMASLLSLPEYKIKGQPKGPKVDSLNQWHFSARCTLDYRYIALIPCLALGSGDGLLGGFSV